MGHECSRHLWYVFRWVLHVKHSGRMQRLFDRGKREEARFVEWLRGIGCEVWEFEDAATKKQYRISGVMGHYGGSLDGIVRLPPKYGIQEPLIAEFKTNGTGSGFTSLRDKGVSVSKPRHFAQMSIYGKYYNLRYGLYNNINKNDDDYHIEIVALDWNLATILEQKAEAVITSQEPPPQLSFNEASFECKYCDFVGICHRDETVEKNCRSCVHAIPVENAEWRCAQYGMTIPKDFIPKGCDKWKTITE